MQTISECPFCGADGVLVQVPAEFGPHYRVDCSRACESARLVGNAFAAIECWNRRARSALADVGEQLSARLLRIGEMDDGPDSLSYSFSLGVWHWQLPEDEAGSGYETLPAAVAALEARFPNGTGKQPRPAAHTAQGHDYFDPVWLGMLYTAADSVAPVHRGAVLRAYEYIKRRLASTAERS